MKTMWTKKFPKKEGLYWFYGYRFKSSKKFGDEAIFILVRVIKTDNNFIYATDGKFMTKSNTGKGLFLKTKYPKIPNKEIIK